jgi:hypothetical protein
MVIEKSYEVFKLIMVDTENREKLFKRSAPGSLLEKIVRFILDIDLHIIEITLERIEKDHLYVLFKKEDDAGFPFASRNAQIEFIKRSQDGFIEIKEYYSLGFFSFNNIIKRRIIDNWGNCQNFKP